MFTLSRRRVLALSAGAAILGAGSARGQAYPDRQIRYVVPYPPGGFNDTLGRIVVQKLQEAWGQPAIVDNRPGGGTLIGTDAVAKSPADGHTLLGIAFPFGAIPSLYRNLPYDSVKDFTPVIFAGQSANLLVVKPSLPVKSVQDLIAAAKANPGKLTYGSTGTGSSNHLSMELFKSMAKVDITHVPYKGSAPMTTDLLGGHIDCAFDNTPNVLPHVKAGTMRAIGVSSTVRSPLAPDVPTVAEAGVPGYEVGVWFGVVAPAGLRPEVLAKLNAELNRMLTMADVKEKFAQQGVEPVGGPPEKFAEHIKEQISKWAAVIKDAGIKPE
jgi:tripartite-type tricarboxylate transporter receptor subunit TctC